MANFLGWLVGVWLGLILAVAVFLALGVTLPPLVGFLAVLTAGIGAVVGTIGVPLTIGLAVAIVVLVYLWAYAFATASIVPGLPAVTLPLPGPVATPTGGPVRLPNFPGELFARGLMIGLTAALDGLVLALIPGVGPFVGMWAFVIVSLSAVILIARSRIFHGFLGWSQWFLPVSYIATVIGLLLFLVNAIPALVGGGLGAFRVDWTTGVIETAGGLTGITGFGGGFSLGNFTFLTAIGLQSNFLAPGISSHETGHSLNTAAMGGVVLWINGWDENWLPFVRRNLAYGELTAESHTMALPGAPRAEFFVGIWG